MATEEKKPDMVVDVSVDVAAAEAARLAAQPTAEEIAATEAAATAKAAEDAATAAAAAEPKPELDAEGRPVAKKQTADERIAELVKRAKDAEKAQFDAEMLVIEKDKEIEAGKPAPKAEAAIGPEPKVADFVYGEADPEYQDALVEHRVSVKMAKAREDFEASRKEDTAKDLQKSYATKVTKTMADGAKAHEDFEAVVSAAKFDSHLARLVVDSDDAVDIAYHLGNNVDELLKVTRASPEERARLIGRLEGKFSATSAARKKTTNAPKVIGKGQANDLAAEEGKYGPSDQDDFDKALLGG